MLAIFDCVFIITATVSFSLPQLSSYWAVREKIIIRTPVNIITVIITTVILPKVIIDTIIITRLFKITIILTTVIIANVVLTTVIKTNVFYRQNL